MRCQRGSPWDKGLCPRCPGREHYPVRQQAADLICCGAHPGQEGNTTGSWIVNLPGQLWWSKHSPVNGDPNTSKRTGLGSCPVVSDVPAVFQSPPWPPSWRNEHTHSCFLQLRVPTLTKIFATLFLVIKMRLLFGWRSAVQLLTRAPQELLAGQHGQPVVWECFLKVVVVLIICASAYFGSLFLFSFFLMSLKVSSATVFSSVNKPGARLGAVPVYTAREPGIYSFIFSFIFPPSCFFFLKIFLYFKQLHKIAEKTKCNVVSLWHII